MNEAVTKRFLLYFRLMLLVDTFSEIIQSGESL